MMKFILSEKPVSELKANLLVVPVWENGSTIPDQITFAHGDLKKMIVETSKEEKFTGELEKSLFLPVSHVLPYQRLLLIGMGKQKDWDKERVRRFGAWAIKAAEKVSAPKIVFALDYFGELDIQQITHALVEGAELGCYRFLKYKSAEKVEKLHLTPIEEIVLAGIPQKEHEDLVPHIRRAQLFAKATMFSRDLINEPASEMTPGRLLHVAQEIALKSDEIQLTYFDKDQARERGMNAFLAIAAGSSREPYFVHLHYSPRSGQPRQKIAVVGKGITFDSGGLSLKPTEAMVDMKIDMSGAANVLGIFSVLCELQPEIEIDGIFPACENMPSGNAVKPGDVVRAMNGKSIEIVNTDAEGRVVLADALCYTVTLDPAFIIDFATLTGASMISLGEEISAAFTNSRELYQNFLHAADEEGEKFWELPLVEDYKKKLESQIADMKNVADNRWGGAITAALFMQEFISEKPWIHLDIAGPSGVWTQFNVVPYISQGGTGFGVRSFLNFLEKISSPTV